MFDTDSFVAGLIDANRESEPRRAVREVLARAVADPSPVADALPPQRGGIEKLYVSPDLTVIKVTWAPGMQLQPHDHRMWAIIGIYAGQEDNTFYRRTAEGVVGSGGKELRVGDVLSLGDEAIHAVTNPLRSVTGAIHVYGGDFFTQPRSEFDPVTLEEKPYDMAGILAAFEAANAVLDAEAQAGAGTGTG